MCQRRPSWEIFGLERGLTHLSPSYRLGLSWLIAKLLGLMTIPKVVCYPTSYLKIDVQARCTGTLPIERTGLSLCNVLQHNVEDALLSFC